MNPETSTRTPTTRGLRRQATIRLALMMLATTLLVGVLAHLAYRSLHANEIANARANLEGFYQLHLQHVARRWDSDAAQLQLRLQLLDRRGQAERVDHDLQRDTVRPAHGLPFQLLREMKTTTLEDDFAHLVVEFLRIDHQAVEVLIHHRDAHRPPRLSKRIREGV